MFLSFDFGHKKIGIASGNTLLDSASPQPPLPCGKNGQPNWDTVATLIAEWQPDTLVVGLPLNMDGSESESSQRARKFGQRLHGRFGLPVFMVDERLSTREARQRTGIHHADPKVDSVAAVIIAEGFLSDGGQRL